jgi:hypothetical protein
MSLREVVPARTVPRQTEARTGSAGRLPVYRGECWRDVDSILGRVGRTL